MIPAAQSSGGQQLLDQIKRLEDRVAELESILVRSGPNWRLQFGNSFIEIAPESVWIESKKVTLYSNVDVWLHAQDITLSSSGKTAIKADGELVLKGQKIVEN